jgi:carboxymethylenebutenolidase
MRAWALVGALFLLSAFTPAPETPPTEAVREAAFAIVDALARSDAETVSAVLAPDFVAVDTRGGVRTAPQFLSDVRATPRNAALPKLRREWSGVHVVTSGDHATFVGRAMWRPANGSAGRSVSSILYTQRWRLGKEGWRLATLQSSRLPPVPEVVEFRSGDLRLKAMLFRPIGAGPFPTIVYAHGNEPDPSDLLETVGPALAARGYLVVGPHRRGSGLSADQAPSLLRRLTEIGRREGVEARSRVAIAELEGAQLDDLAAAIAYGRSLAEVDGDRIFVIGNSFGGVLALLAAERGLGLRGVASFAGAALNWERSALFRERLTRAARNAKVPVFLAQAENDFSTAPTRELGTVLAAAGRPHQARVFPAFGLTPGEGHGLGVDGVGIWFDEVLGFLDRSQGDHR